MYICQSYFSLRYGTLSPEQLVAKASGFGVRRLVLADINNVTGIPDFVKVCRVHQVAPVAGVTVANGNRVLYVLLARNNEGFRQINEFLTAHNFAGFKRNSPESDPPNSNTRYPPEAPVLPDVVAIYPFTGHPPGSLPDSHHLGVDAANASRIFGSKWSPVRQRLMAVQPLVFESEAGYELHRHLRAIDNNTLLSKLDAAMTAPPQATFHPDEYFQHAFHRTPELVTLTQNLLEGCSFDIDFGTVKNKKMFTESHAADRELLYSLAHQGRVKRYGDNNEESVRRITKELEMIDRLGFASYFLITWDMVSWSWRQGYFHVGRGSGANSVVAYCLGITDVDPISLDLYFERFINPLRSSPPDFDIDYSWKDRDAVQQYLFDKYGPRHTALLGAMSTFRDSSMYRELGKVYGLPVEEIDRLADHPDREARENSIARKIVEVASRMVDFPNIRSIHAGGILITEEPITCYTALDLPPKGFATTQWDMYTAEALGFEKLDVLSQRGIGHINDCVKLADVNRGVKVDIRAVEAFKADEAVKDLLRRGETMGCFYIESPAMRGLIRKLKCDHYLTLVAASSIIRPGVAKSGMMREYIWRFHNPGRFSYIHPVMEEQLAETYGVMVYQEDVLKVCHHFAGLDLADADILRRAMSGKFRGSAEMDRIRKRFFDGCDRLGRPEAVSLEVWRQIASFAGYSFSKAHSASYAVESYQSLYLKSRFPIEFMVAVINNFGGFYHTWVYFNEARRWGGEIELPCVNHGQHLTSVAGSKVFVGFVHVKGLETALIHRLMEERERGGLFLSLFDFMQRIGIGSEQITLLIRVGAFRFTGLAKAALLWEAHAYLGRGRTANHQPSLFAWPQKTFTLPVFETEPIEDAYDELNLIGFPVSLSHFDMMKTPFRGGARAADLGEAVGFSVKMLGNLVTIKYVKTSKGELMHFGCFLDVTGEVFDTVHFPDSLRENPFRGYGVYLLQGVVTQEFGQPSVTVQRMAKLPLKSDPREGGGLIC